MRIEIARSLPTVLRLISMVFAILFVLIESIRLFAGLNNCFLLRLIGL